MRESMLKPVRTFKMPYTVSAVAFQGADDNFQALALGLLDGAIVILDLILGFEKMFLEKHPGEITSLAFWEDKCLISGSVDGRVNVCDLDDPGSTQVETGGQQGAPTDDTARRILKCQNC